MINAIIIDDEHGAQEELKLKVNTFCPEVRIVGVGSSVEEGIQLIDNLSPSVVFLDIEMPKSNGFNLLEHYEQYSFSVIFTTAFNEYAIKAIRFCALDYLLKPINAEELKDAVQRVLKVKNSSKQLEELTKNRINGINETIILNSQNDFIRTKIKDIIRFEADRNYTYVFFSNGNKFLVSKTLLFFNDLLEEKDFIRCHRSHLINKIHINKIRKKNQWFAIMSDEKLIPIAHRKKAPFRDLISV